MNAARALAGVALAAWPAAAFAASPPLPFRAAVQVRWGDGAGSDAFRSDLARALSDTLAQRCFVAVDDVEPDADATEAEVIVAVTLSHVQEQTRFLDSIATSLAPGDPAQELRRIAVFEVTVEAVLLAAATQVSVGHKRLVARISRQPIMIGEDPQVSARAMAIERIVGDLTKAFCKGGDKLARKIREAGASDAGEAPPPR